MIKLLILSAFVINNIVIINCAPSNLPATLSCHEMDNECATDVEVSTESWLCVKCDLQTFTPSLSQRLLNSPENKMYNFSSSAINILHFRSSNGFFDPNQRSSIFPNLMKLRPKNITFNSDEFVFDDIIVAQRKTANGEIEVYLEVFDFKSLESVMEQQFLLLHHLNQFQSKVNMTYLDELRVMDLKFSSLCSIEGSFDQFSNLEILDLSNNLIEKITGNNFKDLKELKELNLEANFLEGLDGGLLTGLKSLKILNLQANRIFFISSGTFENSRNLEYLNLAFNRLQKLYARIFNPLVNLKDLYLNNMRINSIEDEAFLGLESLTKLSLKDDHLENISKNTFKGLRGLTHLDLRQSFKHMENITFYELKNLQMLDLSYNDLKSLEEGVLSNQKHLKTLVLDGNRFEDVQKFSTSTKELKELNEISLRNNNITRFSQSSFFNYINLKKLDLSSNKFIEVDERAFDYIFDLNSLNLQGNDINLYETKLFENLDELEELNLIENNIFNVSYDMFANQNKLKTLSLDVCQIFAIENGAFRNFLNLQKLSLNYNHIIQISNKTLRGLRNLTVLDLSSNSISKLDSTKFNELTNLESLNLGNNTITTILADVFANQNNLKELILSMNEISSLENNAFDKLLNLGILDLSENKIKMFPSQIFSKLENLKILELSWNNIHRLGSEIFTNQINLETLSLNNMGIETIADDTFQNLVNLRILDLGTNKIEILSSKTFSRLINLRILDLQYNKITHVGAKAFSNLKKMELLYFQHNTCLSKQFTSTNILFIAKEFFESFCSGCILPEIKNGRAVDVIYRRNFTGGNDLKRLETVRIICDPGYGLVVEYREGNLITCTSNDGWSKDFPKCQQLCRGQDIIGHTTKETCFYNKKRVPCDRHHATGTIAELSCEGGYQMPKNVTDVISLTCLESGKWNQNPLKCDPICGRISANSAVTYIQGGSITEVSDVPWHVAIYLEILQINSDEPLNELICGGTILTKKIVLSAAQCVFDESKDKLIQKELLTVYAGKFYRSLLEKETPAPQKFSIQEIRTVPGYKGVTSHYISDISILILKSAIIIQPNVIPICIDMDAKFGLDRAVSSGEIGLVAGWGSIDAFGTVSSVLRKINMPVVDFYECKAEAEAFKDFVTGDKFCSGFKTGEGVCWADVGGGMALKKETDNEQVYYLRGIVSNGKYSNGNYNACENFYTLFTNVLEYLPFIKAAIEDFP